MPSLTIISSHNDDITTKPSAVMSQLHNQFDFLKDMIDALPYQIVVQEVVSSTETKVIAANRMTFLVSGFAPTDLVGKYISDIFPPAQAIQIIQQVQRCVALNTTVEIEELLHLPNGDLWHHSSYIPLETADGQAPRVLIAIQDITARKQREIEEHRRQEEIITHQATTLGELSTPLLAISERTVVMPLVGGVDSRRVQQIMEALLSGVAEYGATSVILDITGVPIVDTQVANALVHAAQAVKLLGAQVVLTGIRPEVAQTLVGLGIDLRSIVVRGTLRDGITYALRSLGN